MEKLKLSLSSPTLSDQSPPPPQQLSQQQKFLSQQQRQSSSSSKRSSSSLPPFKQLLSNYDSGTIIFDKKNLSSIYIVCRDNSDNKESDKVDGRTGSNSKESNKTNVNLLKDGDELSEIELIECKSVKMEGKNEIPVKDWVNGYQFQSGKMKFENAENVENIEKS